MGLDPYESFTTWSTRYRIPCDGGPPEEIGGSAFMGEVERPLPDGRMVTREFQNFILDPEQADPEPFADCPSSCTPDFRIMDDQFHIYSYTNPEIIEQDEDGVVVDQYTGNGDAISPIAPLSNGVMTLSFPGARLEASCWSGGVSGGPTLAADADDFGIQSLVNRIPYTAPNDGAVVIGLGDRPGSYSESFSFYRVTCSGVEWSSTMSFSGGGIAPGANASITRVWWMSDGNVLFSANMGGSFTFDGNTGADFVGVLDGDTGDTIWMKASTGNVWSPARGVFSVAPGPDDTVWVSTEASGVSVFDGAGTLLLGEDLP